jgi:FkbM family methyltransferase
VFLTKRYPKATIVALEPALSNFSMLVKNTRSLTNVHAVNAGLWSKSCNLSIKNPNADNWSFQVTEDAHGTIGAMSVPDVMAAFNATRVDVLKMDIEGAEAEVMRHSSEWIAKVQHIVIELHERYSPGCTGIVEAAVSGFHRRKAGENLVFSQAAPTAG